MHICKTYFTLISKQLLKFIFVATFVPHPVEYQENYKISGVKRNYLFTTSREISVSSYSEPFCVLLVVQETCKKKISLLFVRFR